MKIKIMRYNFEAKMPKYLNKLVQEDLTDRAKIL